MSPGVDGLATALKRFPRVSGDEPGAYTLLPTRDLFSPRERG